MNDREGLYGRHGGIVSISDGQSNWHSDGSDINTIFCSTLTHSTSPAACQVPVVSKCVYGSDVSSGIFRQQDYAGVLPITDVGCTSDTYDDGKYRSSVNHHVVCSEVYDWGTSFSNVESASMDLFCSGHNSDMYFDGRCEELKDALDIVARDILETRISKSITSESIASTFAESSPRQADGIDLMHTEKDVSIFHDFTPVSASLRPTCCSSPMTLLFDSRDEFCEDVDLIRLQDQVILECGHLPVNRLCPVNDGGVISGTAPMTLSYCGRIPAVHCTFATIHSTVPTMHNTVPAIHSTVPTMHSDVPAICSTVPAIHSSVPTIHSNLPTMHSSVPAIHNSVPTIHSNLPTIHSTIPTIHSTIPTIHSSIRAILSSHPTMHSSMPTIHPTITAINISLPTELNTANCVMPHASNAVTIDRKLSCIAEELVSVTRAVQEENVCSQESCYVPYGTYGGALNGTSGRCLLSLSGNTPSEGKAEGVGLEKNVLSGFVSIVQDYGNQPSAIAGLVNGKPGPRCDARDITDDLLCQVDCGTQSSTRDVSMVTKDACDTDVEVAQHIASRLVSTSASISSSVLFHGQSDHVHKLPIAPLPRKPQLISESSGKNCVSMPVVFVPRTVRALPSFSSQPVLMVPGQNSSVSFERLMS